MVYSPVPYFTYFRGDIYVYCHHMHHDYCCTVTWRRLSFLLSAQSFENFILKQERENYYSLMNFFLLRDLNMLRLIHIQNYMVCINTKIITESENHLGWKRSLRLSGPTFDWSPHCQLNHSTKWHAQAFLEHLNWW